MANSPESSSESGVKRVRRATKKKRPVTRIESATSETTAPVHGQSESSDSGGGFNWSMSIGVSERDIVVFLRQMVMLLDAGTPLLKSLRTLAERSEHDGTRRLVSDMAQYVEMGNPLWQAFERHGRHFNTIFVNLVKASEASGTLVPVLKRLAKYREARGMLRRRVWSATLYPAAVLIACLGVVFLIGKFVLPEFALIFEKLDAAVPPFTVWFMNTFAFLTSLSTVIWAVVILVALVVVYKLLMRNPLYRLKMDRLKLMIPYIGPGILRKNAVVEMTRTMSLLLSSGLSMMVTLDLTRSAINNRAMAQVLQDVRDSVERGEGFEAPLRNARGIVPPVVTDMLVTGEETGQLDSISLQIADAYEEEVNISINSLSELMPVIVTVIMGGFVLLLVMAVFVPLISMLDSLGASGG
jgi:type IV pilus assembly protein PilC